MKYSFLLFFGLMLTQTGFAQSVKMEPVSVSDSLYLNIIIPEEDTVVYSFSRYRVAANTHPLAKAYINGNEVQVYPNGAFVDMINHVEDTTEIEFMVSLNTQNITRKLLLVRPPINEDLIPSKLLTNKMVLPSDDIWLKTGELLEVQFRGKPGQTAVFNIDGFKRNIPMKELPPEYAGGRSGVYKGEYRIMPGDHVAEKNITFKVKKNFLSYSKMKGDFKISLNGLPRTGEVNSDNAYLNVGMGTDRLGGAKFGFLEEGVRLKITGLKNDNYRVQLTSSLDAWIPVHFVDLLPEETPSNDPLTGSIRVTGNDKEDVISLSVGAKLPYITYQEIDPNKIIVDVFGTTSNTNWNTKHLNAEGIEEVEWRQVENDRFRLIIKLNHAQNWGYSVGYGWGSQLQIKVKRAPIIPDILEPLKGRTIAVDAGHGGESKGALGAGGFLEKEVTLMIAEKLDTLLRSKGAKVIMTRTDDSEIYMSERKDIILRNNADLLVSIHANSIGYGSNPVEIKGTGTFYKHIAFKPLAEVMYNKMLELDLDQYGMTGSFNFSLSAPIEYPNVLVETAFISNPEEEILLSDPDFQERIARKIVNGLEEYYLENAQVKSVGDF